MKRSDGSQGEVSQSTIYSKKSNSLAPTWTPNVFAGENVTLKTT